MDAITDRNTAEIEGIYAFQATNIIAELGRIRAALVVGVDATIFTKIVFGCFGIELIDAQVLRTLHDFEFVEPYRCYDGPPAAAHRAVAAARVFDAVGQGEAQTDCAAMAGQVVDGFDGMGHCWHRFPRLGRAIQDQALRSRVSQPRIAASSQATTKWGQCADMAQGQTLTPV